MAQDLAYSSSRLSLLEAFRLAIWGNDSIFLKQSARRSGSTMRTIEYLDFGEHLEAVQIFCHALADRKLVVFQEYRDAMYKFRNDFVYYDKGAFIMGQPGIGETRCIHP